MDSSENITRKLREQRIMKIEKKLDEASFEQGGHTYTSAFGHYSMDGKPISRDDYFKARDGDNASTPTEKDNTDTKDNSNEEKLSKLFNAKPGEITVERPYWAEDDCYYYKDKCVGYIKNGKFVLGDLRSLVYILPDIPEQPEEKNYNPTRMTKKEVGSIHATYMQGDPARDIAYVLADKNSSMSRLVNYDIDKSGEGSVDRLMKRPDIREYMDERVKDWKDYVQKLLSYTIKLEGDKPKSQKRIQSLVNAKDYIDKITHKWEDYKKTVPQDDNAKNPHLSQNEEEDDPDIENTRKAVSQWLNQIDKR